MNPAHQPLTPTQTTIIVTTLLAEIAVYGVLGIAACRNIYYFLIKQKFYKHVHMVTFYFLTFTVLAGRII